MEHHDSCPLCGSVNIKPEFTATDFFVSGESFTVFGCDECSFRFTGDHPSESEAGKYYESDKYISHSDTSAGLMNKIYRSVRGYMMGRKAAMVRRATGLETGSLLDIGSGTGYFLKSMQKKKWHVSGIEINDAARHFASEHFGLSVNKPADIKAFRNNSFDCITLWHVLEHFIDPDWYMGEISRLLQPGGICIIALPNCSSFDAKKYKEAWAAWDVPRHLWHFTPATFARFAKKSGFHLVEIKQLPFDVFYISAMSEKYSGSGLSFVKGMITGTWFWFLSLLKRDRASSLVYFLTKA